MAGKGKARLCLTIAAVLALGAAALWYVNANQRTQAEVGGFLRDGRAGFVATQFDYALGPDGAESNSCPDGMSKGVTEIFGESPEGLRRRGENDEDYTKRLKEGGKTISVSADGKDYCANPALAPPDSHARYLTNPAALAEGFDLDGKVSRSPDDIAAGRHDFSGVDGSKGVDNQFWRVTGCSKPYQKAGSAGKFGGEMYTGSWGILIALEDVDNLKNDDHIVVRFYSNADPMAISPNREALEFATYAFDRNPALQAKTTGKLTNGVLTTEPVDFLFKRVTNAIYVDRPLKQARIRATLSADGKLKGYLGGFTPIEKFYDFQFGYRTAKLGNGKPAPPRRIMGTANGAARSQNYTCQGMYQGLHRFADGDFDKVSGKFTSISTQYKIEARPAFVVDAQTKSGNEALVKQ